MTAHLISDAETGVGPWAPLQLDCIPGPGCARVSACSNSLAAAAREIWPRFGVAAGSSGGPLALTDRAGGREVGPEPQTHQAGTEREEFRRQNARCAEMVVLGRPAGSSGRTGSGDPGLRADPPWSFAFGASDYLSIRAAIEVNAGWKPGHSDRRGGGGSKHAPSRVVSIWRGIAATTESWRWDMDQQASGDRCLASDFFQPNNAGGQLSDFSTASSAREATTNEPNKKKNRDKRATDFTIQRIEQIKGARK